MNFYWNGLVWAACLPRPLTGDSLLDYIETCRDEMFCEFPSTSVVLAGDFNQLDDNSFVERTGFAQLVQ